MTRFDIAGHGGVGQWQRRFENRTDKSQSWPGGRRDHAQTRYSDGAPRQAAEPAQALLFLASPL
ncbi:hypothetical protein KIF59_15685 [Enterobacter cloacae subsp. cloacae]|nr:hypothetical protein [Enterobacter cloacae subsp. cloacae]